MTTTQAPHETNPLTDSRSYYKPEEQWAELTLGELATQGGRITRVRFLTQRVGGGHHLYDLSYVHGALRDGTKVRVLGVPHIALEARTRIKPRLVSWAVDQGVNGKEMGLLDDADDGGTWSVLYD